MLHAEVALLEMLAQLRYDARKNQVLRVGFEIRDVHHVHGAIAKLTEWQIAHRAVVGHEPAAAREIFVRRLRTFRIVATWCVRHDSAFCFSIPREQIAKPALELAERLHPMRRG